MNETEQQAQKHVYKSAIYNISTDYNLLWELIKAGHEVPAWVVYDVIEEKVFWDIVSARNGWKSKGYSIGSRGIGYSGIDQTYEEFVSVCIAFSLHFILPITELKNGTKK